MPEKSERILPPLCLAVKRVREAFTDTQERFASRIGVAVMTVSHFETGRSEPRDPRVLLNLAKVAAEIAPLARAFDDHDEEIARAINLIEPEKAQPVMTVRNAERLFKEAYEDWEHINQTKRYLERIYPSDRGPAFRSMREWRLSFAARLAALYFPEQVAAIEKAAAPAIAIIDDVLSRADESQIDYTRFEREVLALAERQALSQFKARPTKPAKKAGC
jgi:transcriptional regulator with XRE-family HTH domain